jgi:hypothetical protein
MVSIGNETTEILRPLNYELEGSRHPELIGGLHGSARSGADGHLSKRLALGVGQWRSVPIPQLGDATVAATLSGALLWHAAICTPHDLIAY